MLGQLLLGKYRVTRLLDEGGMSKVYLARQATPAREAVVKVLKPHLLAQPKAREHFRREIHIISRFQHPHAVAFYDSAPNDPRGPILVMEYLRGVDLNALLQRGRFTPERAGRLLAQICDVLGAAHEAGIVHRDVKPGNLMVLYPGTPQETIKLMDFGLAKMTSLLYISPDELVDFNLPAASGTPEYIAPEQVRAGDVDGRADLYSVGVVLYEMLTGKRPFAGSVDALLDAHLDAPPPSFAEKGVRDVPPAVEELVQVCLAKSADHRPRTAAELIQQYELALGKRFTVARRGGLSGASPGLAMTPTPPPRGPGLALAAPATAAPSTSADRHALHHSVEVSMPEAMAMVKLKGFIYDLGGEVVESVPGMIRVRLRETEKKSEGGLFGWFGGQQVVQTASGTDLELRMERKDPQQPSRLTITLVMRRAGGMITVEWRDRCKKIGRDLGAYLMGR
jgi:serine/threonine-protein kinase